MRPSPGSLKENPLSPQPGPAVTAGTAPALSGCGREVSSADRDERAVGAARVLP